MSDQDPPVTRSDEADDLSLDKVLRKLARDFLKDFFELLFPDLVPVLDLTTAEFVGDELFASFRKKGHVRPDVVVKLETRDGEDQFAIFHAEMEGEFRNETEKRLKRYFHHLGIEYDDPPVITAVLFRTGGPAGIKKREVVRKVGPWVSNRFYYLAFGLSGSLAEEWLQRPQSVAAALAAFMGSQIWDPVEKKLRCLEAISRTEPDKGRQYTLGEAVKAAVQLDEAETARFDQELEKREEVKKMLLSWDEALAQREAQGMALGKTEGMALGRAEGEIKQAREAVLLVVRHRWGSIPDDFAAKLESINELARLHEIMEQALDVRSLDEIDLGP